MLEKNERRAVWDLALPNVLSNITVPLLGLADMALLGHMGSPVYLGAVSVGAMIFNFIYWSFGFLRMGTSGFAAQAHGRGDWPAASLLLARSLLVGGLVALSLLLFQVPIARLSFWLVGGSAEVEALASSYFYLRIWAAPATMGLYGLTGWFIGMQNARAPLLIAVWVNVLNIAFNYFFALGLGMGSDGVALGTVVAEYGGLLLGYFLLRRHHGHLLRYVSWRNILDRAGLVAFFLVNADIFVRTVSIMLVFSFFTAQSAAYGDTLLAVNSLLMQFFMFFSYLVDGLGHAAEALVGRHIGARQARLLRSTLRYLFAVGAALALAFALAYALLGRSVLSLLTDNAEVIRAAGPFLAWSAAVPLLGFASFLWDGAYVGATAGKAMRDSMLLASFGVFLPSFYLLEPWLGNHALWLALCLFLACRSLVQTLWRQKAIYSRLDG